MKTRICMLHNFTLKRGGAERLLFTLSNLLQKAGYEIDIYVLEDDPTECFPELRGSLHVKPVLRVRRPGILRSVATFIPVTAAINMVAKIQGHYDLIHAHNFPANIAAFFATKSRMKVPFIWGCNEPYRLLYDRGEQYRFMNYDVKSSADRLIRLTLVKLLEAPAVFDKYAAMNAYAITALSDFTANQIKSIYGVKPMVIHPGIEKNSLNIGVSGQLIRDLFDIGASPLILTVSRLWPAKNIETGLSAFSILVKKIPDAHYMIVGDGPILENLRLLSNQLGIEKSCTFVSDKSVAELGGLGYFYAACNVFLFTAIGEPWGFVILEAMCFGKPVVVSASGGPMEYIQHQKTGILV
ncbi:MAG TPA: glycosyltransferase family 4 protein, partial [Candidatus Bathyarchaeia archaeon]|nr:glycosyltransferase family 4 protein [Candidatus Bathyarchaeia archaeon]